MPETGPGCIKPPRLKTAWARLARRSWAYFGLPLARPVPPRATGARSGSPGGGIASTTRLATARRWRACWRAGGAVLQSAAPAQDRGTLGGWHWRGRSGLDADWRIRRLAAVKIVPGAGFVGVNDGALGDPRLDESEHGRKRVAVAFADHDHGLTLAALIVAEPAMSSCLR
jgi:hypothetical protein